MRILKYNIDCTIARYRKAIFSKRHTISRIDEIRAALNGSKPHQMLAWGDSHVECLRIANLDVNVINGGICGSTASSCLKTLRSVATDRKIDSSILIVGTNDIARRDALTTKRVRKFSADVTSIVEILKTISFRVLISPLPPVPVDAPSFRDGLSAEVYSNELKIICINNDCHFIDLFDFMRGERFGVSSSDWFRDGLHLRDYDRIACRLNALVELDQRAAIPG